MNVLPSTSPPKHVSLLGYGGLLPFIFLALLIPFSLDYRPLFAIALVNYGAVILSFVGALRICRGTRESGNLFASSFASYIKFVTSRDFSLRASATAQ